MFIKTKKICAVIPFYNEEKFIRETFVQTLNYVDLIIAVDDGSTDNSLKKINDLKNIILIKHNANKGKGAALRSGFLKAIQLECKLLVTLDADLQHPPELIPKFLDYSQKNNLDIVIGNRLKNLSEMPFQRRLSNFLTSFLISKKTGLKIFDSQSGYRLFNSDKLNFIIPHFNGFEAESEILVKAARKKFKIGFLDIPTVYNSNESKMKSLQAIIGFIKVLFI